MKSRSATSRITDAQDNQLESLLLECLISRRSVHPRRLIHPGPDQLSVRQMIEIAVTAIDHGGLRPWRFISITGRALAVLGDVFVKIKLEHHQELSEEELVRERNRAEAVPSIIAVIDRTDANHNSIPLKEQHASLGAAVQNIVLSAHLMGFGAKMVSGKKVTHPMLAKSLGLANDETVFGFVCIGTSVPGTSKKARASVDDVLASWNPELNVDIERVG